MKQLTLTYQCQFIIFCIIDVIVFILWSTTNNDFINLCIYKLGIALIIFLLFTALSSYYLNNVISFGILKDDSIGISSYFKYNYFFLKDITRVKKETFFGYKYLVCTLSSKETFILVYSCLKPKLKHELRELFLKEGISIE